MKKSGLLTELSAVLIAAVLLISGCGTSAKTIDAQALAQSLLTEIQYDDSLKELDDEDVTMYMDVPENVDPIVYMGSGSTAEEVGVFTAKDTDTAKTMLDNVRSYLDDQQDSFADYKPQEAKRVGNAVLEQKGNYVVLCVSGDPETAKKLIEKAFK